MASVETIIEQLMHSVAIRTLAKPVMELKRSAERRKYERSEDSEYIKTFKEKHKGRRCFVIGNGPSLTGEDLDLIKDEISFACNRIFKIYDKTEWRPTYYMCGDRQRLYEDIDKIKKLDCDYKFVTTWADVYGRIPEDNLHYFLISGPFEPHVERKIQKTVQEDVSKYFSAAQTITCNEIEFAIYMGFKEIYLLGVDHNYPVSIDITGKKIIDKTIKDHFEGGELEELQKNYIYSDAATKCYENIEKYAKEHGIKIYNATRGGKLEAFERVKLEDVV